MLVKSIKKSLTAASIVISLSAITPSALAENDEPLTFENVLQYAKEGGRSAQLLLALAYHHADDETSPYYVKEWGLSVDKKKAAEWYRKAANQGDEFASFYLAELYYYGEGVPQDYSKAFEWYRKAANQGDEVAQFNVGVMYDQGKGVRQDQTKAVEWYRKAANQGYEKARLYLGVKYFLGEGVRQDKTKAVELFEKLCGNGYTDACDLIN